MGDFSKALKIYETNCKELKLGHSCHKVGGYKNVGRECEENHVRSVIFSQSYLSLHNRETEHAHVFQDEAYSYFRRGCDYNYYPACLNAGLYDFLNEKANPRKEHKADMESALKLFQKACDEGELAEACHRYAGIKIAGTGGVPVSQTRFFISIFYQSTHYPPYLSSYTVHNPSPVPTMPSELVMQWRTRPSAGVNLV